MRHGMNGVFGTISITRCPKDVSELGEFVSGTLLMLIYAIEIIHG